MKTFPEITVGIAAPVHSDEIATSSGDALSDEELAQLEQLAERIEQAGEEPIAIAASGAFVLRKALAAAGVASVVSSSESTVKASEQKPVAYLVDYADIGEGTGRSCFYEEGAKQYMESAVSYSQNVRKRPCVVTSLYTAPADLTALTQERDRLREALEAARRDAARYRHIRDTTNNGYHLSGPSGIGKWQVSHKVRAGEGEYLFGDRLDAAIDAAIAAQQK